LLVLGFAIIGVMIVGPSIANAVTYESYRAVKISHYLHGVKGNLNTKFNKVGSAKDFMVYLNFEDFSTIGAGHFVVKQDGIVTNLCLIYHKIDGGYAVRDATTCSLEYPTRYRAAVEQTGEGSYCFRATTYYPAEQTFCLSHNRATVAGAIGHTFADYSSTNTLNVLFDRLQTAYWSNVQGDYLWKFFTDDESVESKCFSTDNSSNNSWVEDDRKKWAPDGSPNAEFDDIGIGPTSFTEDNCSIELTAWEPYGI
jgi:hypothetical protein